MYEMEKNKAAILLSGIPKLRDPYILVENGDYYAYGTGWGVWKNTGGTLTGPWQNLGLCVEVPSDAIDCHWAPEVHKYKGAYYMFTTYLSGKLGHRGCAVFRAKQPEGPFIQLSSGLITPSDWDAIDGTFYVDGEGQPWMVFVHEWTSTEDGVGRMAAVRLSRDLTCMISEPIELFRADDPEWTGQFVTDGPFLYTCKDGTLLMIWSNFNPSGYCVGIARSENGRVDGNWIQEKRLLYEKGMTGEYDGGHGMIFTGLDGRLYLSIHSPNDPECGRPETPVFVPIREENNTIIWDLGRETQ